LLLPEDGDGDGEGEDDGVGALGVAVLLPLLELLKEGL